MANVKISGLPSATTPLTGAELVPVVQGGVTSQTTIDDFGNIINKQTMLGGAVRYDGGAWAFINDSAHSPIGMSSVSAPDAYSYKVHYSQTASKVGTILSVIDAELSPYGIHTGASGATDSATFNMYAPCVLYVNGTSSVSASPLWTSQTGPISAYTTSVVITHAYRSLAVDPPRVTPIVPNTGSLTRQYEVAWTSTTTTITSLDDIQGYAYYDGTNWQLSLCPNLGVSISYSAGGLTVTHPDATGHFNVQLTGLNTNLRPEIASIGNSNFVIQFRDTAGAVVGPAATTDMKVLFRRCALVPSTMDAGVRFAVDLGLCKVANADVGNISLNNFWLIGMNNP
jgi:hypothetical protein